MNRDGFALIAVLWVLAALSVTIGTSVGVAHVGVKTSENRIILTRAGWARDACVAIVQARFAADTTLRQVDSIDLGRGTACRLRLDDPGERINMNTADEAMLVTLFGADSLAHAVLDWRDADHTPHAAGVESDWYVAWNRMPPRNGPFADVSELRYVRGITPSVYQTLSPLLTTFGDGRVNLNTAPARVLAALPLLGDLEARRIVATRGTRGGSDDGGESPANVAGVRGAGGMGEYRDFVRSTTLESPIFVATAEGWVTGFVPRATATVVLARDESGLVVLRQEVP